MEERDDGGAGEEVSVCKVSPGADGEGSAGVLGLNRVWVIRERQPLRRHEE